MYDFYERLVSFALPRVRDFKGLPPKAFDGRGNYTIGIKEQLIFPEIDFDKIEKTKGMNITITTTAQNDEQGLCLIAIVLYFLIGSPIWVNKHRPCSSF
jgi:large subunit ribosomal protein L5